MKRVTKSYHKEYYPVVFWRENLAELIETLGSSVTLSTDDYEFETLDDAARHFGSHVQHELKVASRDPSAEVEFSRTRVRLFVGSGPDRTRVFHELDKIIRSRQRSLAVGYNMLLMLAIGLLNIVIWFPLERLGLDPLWWQACQFDDLLLRLLCHQ